MARKKKINLKKCLDHCSKWIDKHWIFYAAVVTFSGVWFSLALTYLGTFLKLKDENGLTVFGWILTVVVVSLMVFSTIMKKYSERKSVEYSSGYVVYDTLFSTLSQAASHKITSQISGIQNALKEGKIYSSRPCDQLRELIKAIKNSLLVMLGEDDYAFQPDDIYVSLAYRFPVEPNCKWRWASSDSRVGTGIEELNSNPCSTFNYLIKNQKDYVFFNNKNEAFKEQHYAPDPDEDKVDGVYAGSIACYRIEVSDEEHTYIEAVLSISTYHKHFSKEDDEDSVNNVKNNIRKMICDSFSEPLKVELNEFYLNKLHNKIQINPSKGTKSKPEKDNIIKTGKEKIRKTLAYFE